MADGRQAEVRAAGGVRDGAPSLPAADAHGCPGGHGRACERAGLERRGAHRFRHALATEMLRAGASLPEVGQVLRHRSTLSTSLYAKVDEDALRPLARPWPGTAA
ncbi:MAG: tyrosine-type recombinase/integrase [Trebonia sp.]